MTKPLSKTEKAARAKSRAEKRHLAASIDAKVNAKKKAGGLSRSDRDDMNAAVAYIKLTNYSSADDVRNNVRRLNIYSRACEAIANAVERGLLDQYPESSQSAGYYYLVTKNSPAQKNVKPKKAAPTKKPGKALATVRVAVRSLEEELVRCNEELAREKDKVEVLDGLYRVSCDGERTLRGQRERLRNRAAGLELQIEEQHATLRIERFEHGLLCKRITLVARALEKQHVVLMDAFQQHYNPSRKPRKPTITNWAEWIGEQAEELMAILNKATKWGEDVRADRIVLLRGGQGGDGLREAWVDSLQPVRTDRAVVNTFGSAARFDDTVENAEYKTKIMIEKKTKATARRRA